MESNHEHVYELKDQYLAEERQMLLRFSFELCKICGHERMIKELPE